MSLWLDGASRVWARLPMRLRVAALRAANHTVTLGVVGVVYDARGRVLVLDHRFRPRWTWGLPGGFLGPGEPLVAGLVRELREETGLVLDVEPTPLDVEHLVGPGAVTVTYAARARRVEGGEEGPEGPRLVLCDELRGGGFFAPDALPDGMYPHHAAIVRRWASARERT